MSFPVEDLTPGDILWMVDRYNSRHRVLIEIIGLKADNDPERVAYKIIMEVVDDAVKSCGFEGTINRSLIFGGFDIERYPQQ